MAKRHDLHEVEPVLHYVFIVFAVIVAIVIIMLYMLVVLNDQNATRSYCNVNNGLDCVAFNVNTVLNSTNISITLKDITGSAIYLNASSFYLSPTPRGKYLEGSCDMLKTNGVIQNNQTFNCFITINNFILSGVTKLQPAFIIKYENYNSSYNITSNTNHTDVVAGGNLTAYIIK